MFRVRIVIKLMMFSVYVFEYVYRLIYISFGCTVSVFNTIINYL